MKIQKFRIATPDEELSDLRQRLSATRWADELADSADYGVSLAYLKDLVDYWRNGFDWRARERWLNTFPQYVTEIDGQRIHFVHVKSQVETATPVILTHGWPCTFVEYLNLVERLINPAAHGGTDRDAFHVVIPSLPGFAYSGPTKDKGWNRFRTAHAWAELMRRLGYERYIAAGNDVGSLVSPEIGRVDPERVMGVHVTQVFSFPSGDPKEFEQLTADDMKNLEFLQWFVDNMGAFNKLQSTKPQTLAHALADSPVGQLAWNCQLLGEGHDRDFVLTNATIYWLTNTAASAARFYYEDAHATAVPAEPTQVPLGLANFANDFPSIRPFAQRDHANIVSWNVYQEGGHFSTENAPDLLVQDLRAFAAML